MKLRHAWARFEQWLHPTLTVPTHPAAAPRVAPLAAPGLAGYRAHGVTVPVTPLGEIPIPPGCRVSVLEVAAAVAWIHCLPELAPESRRA